MDGGWQAMAGQEQGVALALGHSFAYAGIIGLKSVSQSPLDWECPRARNGSL